MYFFEQDLETQMDIIYDVIDPIQKIREKIENGGVDISKFQKDPAKASEFQIKIGGFGAILEILKYGIKEHRQETLEILSKLYGMTVEEMKTKTNAIQLMILAKRISKREDIMELFTR